MREERELRNLERLAKVMLVVMIILIVTEMISCTRQAKAATRGVGSPILTADEIYLMAAAMELENGCNSDLCLLYTGTVIMNRRNSPEWPDTVQGVLLQKGQYASHTVNNLYTVQITDRVMRLALRVATHRSLDDEIIFQSMQPKLGRVKYVIDGEYFAR